MRANNTLLVFFIWLYLVNATNVQRRQDAVILICGLNAVICDGGYCCNEYQKCVATPTDPVSVGCEDSVLTAPGGYKYAAQFVYQA
jgi:hypothetical protein